MSEILPYCLLSLLRANLEPIVGSCKPTDGLNTTVDCIHHSGWLPQSFHFSLYFILALGVFTIFYRTALPPLLVSVF